jgi:hypothetical protein
MYLASGSFSSRCQHHLALDSVAWDQRPRDVARDGREHSDGLAAILLFRGLSFWAPMGPGLFIWRRVSRMRRADAEGTLPQTYWASPPKRVMAALGTTAKGFTAVEVTARLNLCGHNVSRSCKAHYSCC